MDEDSGSFSEFLKRVTDLDDNCMTCKIVSGGGLLFAGLYFLQHRNNFGKITSYVQSTLGLGLVGLAFARALDLPPFSSMEHGGHLTEKTKRTTE